MVSEYTEYKIIDIRKNKDSLNIIRIKHKQKVTPGQFFIAGALGFGEETLPVSFSDGENLELSFFEKSEAAKKIQELKKKDLILLRGPYGHGFPMNNLRHKEIFIIGENTLFAPLSAAISYIGQSREYYEKVSVIVLFKQEGDELPDALKKTDGKADTKSETHVIKARSLEEIKKTVTGSENAMHAEYLLSLGNKELKEILLFLKEKGISERQVYFYLNRKISCGKGICGSCAVFGIHACIDGPVIRADRLTGFFE